MKKIFRIFNVFMIFAICFCIGNFSHVKVKAYTVSQSEIVIEKTSGRILHEVNANQKLPIASTTKIVTAITVIDNFDISKEIVVPQSCQGVEGSSIYLKTGEKYTVQDLLYGLMLRSGNDSAKTLAVCLGGSEENFVNLMNTTAKKLGANNSNFTNPHGLHDENHYSTAYDLAIITKYALNNQTFEKIVGCKNYTATELVSGEKRVWTNKNKMLTTFDGATGVKTGFTKKAGRCLVSSAKRNGMDLICVVLNSPQMFERSKELLNDCFQRFNLVKIIDKDKFKYSLPTKDGKYYELEIRQSFYYPVQDGEVISAKVNLPKLLEREPKKGEVIGKIEIYGSKQLIFSQNIYTL